MSLCAILGEEMAPCTARVSRQTADRVLRWLGALSGSRAGALAGCGAAPREANFAILASKLDKSSQIPWDHISCN